MGRHLPLAAHRAVARTHLPACCAQVPSDSEMLLATIKMERRTALAVPPLPSTFVADVAAITGTPSSNCSNMHFSCEDRTELTCSYSRAACWGAAGTQVTLSWSRRGGKPGAWTV